MHDAHITAYIALGANLGHPAHAVELAIQSLAGNVAHTRLGKVSSLYRSTALEGIGPDYINAVVQIFTRLPAYTLLEQLQNIERNAGRERSYRNAPRTLDLDILLYGDAQIGSDTLTVPHPRMQQRAFVLQPLWEIAPVLVDAQSLAGVAGQQIVKL